MPDWLFDSRGTAKLFLYDGERFISRNGKNLGWLFGKNVYSLNGKHIGWFEDGILYDGQNDVLAFMRNCKGHLPSRPAIGGIPATPAIPARPGRPGLSGTMGRPGKGGWSRITIQEFFGVDF